MFYDYNKMIAEAWRTYIKALRENSEHLSEPDTSEVKKKSNCENLPRFGYSN